MLSDNFTKWSNTLKQFVGKLPTNFLGVFDYLVGLALKGLMQHKEEFKRDTENYKLISGSFTHAGSTRKCKFLESNFLLKVVLPFQNNV